MPGLKPIYRPVFTDDQIKEAEQICKKHSAPFNQVQRAKLVLLLHDRPDIENPVAGQILGRHENWVRTWRKRWCQDGFSLVDRHRSGRKPTFSPSGSCAD
jgi:hypothetical protein